MIESRYIDFKPDKSTQVTYTITTGYWGGKFCFQCGKEMFQEFNDGKLGDWMCINCGTKVIEK